jgi:SAM-dependent methyltransferase
MMDSTGAGGTPDPLKQPTDGLREDADIATSSEDYTRRFVGGVGRWFLETQKRVTLKLLRALPAGASVLDVGGGHAQITPTLIEAGYEVTVAGSDPVCADRLATLIAQGKCRFDTADFQALPYAAQSFDVVVCLRLLPHSVCWTGLIAELCRVSRRSVLLDYPSTRSANILAAHLFQLKKGIEVNTRGYMMFTPGEIHTAFAKRGFKVSSEQPQFLIPMALHRWTNQPAVSKLAEAAPRLLGLTRWLGSPIIVRADRQHPEVDRRSKGLLTTFWRTVRTRAPA